MQPLPFAPFVQFNARKIATKQAWRDLGIGVASIVGGTILGVLGLVTGFIVFIALAIVIAGTIRLFGGILTLIDPTRKLDNLGLPAARAQALQAAEAELSHPARSELRTSKGVALLGPSWFAYHDAETLIVTRRDDILWFFKTVTKRSARMSMKMHLRHGTVKSINVTQLDEHLFAGLDYALPFAFKGFEANLGTLPRAHIAYEVDRRRAAATYGVRAA